MKILLIIIAIVGLIYIFSSDNGPSNSVSDNYGQYDKGTALCDKGAYGDAVNLCE